MTAITFPPIADTPIGDVFGRWVRTYQGRWGLRFANRRDVPDITLVPPTGGDETEYTVGDQTWRSHVFEYTGDVAYLTVTQTVRGKLRVNAGGGPGGPGYSNGVLAFAGGGGGAGGDFEDEVILEPGVYALYVGNGGTATFDTPQNGEPSIWNGHPDALTDASLICDGGGAGGHGGGQAGGSGGGGAEGWGITNPGGAATYGSLDGGTTPDDGTRIKGSNGNASSGGGRSGYGGGPNGGLGSTSSITGTAETYSVAGPKFDGPATAPGPGSGGRGGAPGGGNLGDDGVPGRITFAYRAA